MRRALRGEMPGATLIGLVLCVGVAMPARAAEPEARYLTHDAVAAVAADIDDDGAREVVLALDGSGQGVRLLQVWDHVGALWQSIATEVVSRPAEDGGLVLLDPGEESLSLLAWRDGIRERALLAVGGDAADYGGGCCLRLGLVAVKGRELGVQWVEAPSPRVEQVAILDADADGTDELLVVEPPDGAGDRHVHLLTWQDDRFAGERISLGDDDGTGRSLHVGETDGVAGDEAVFAVDAGRSLMRIGLDFGGTLLAERGALGDAPELHLWAWGAAGGRIVVQVGTELRVLRWPRGGEPETVAQTFRPDYPEVAVVGEGAEALILDRGVVGFDPRNAPSLEILDLSLRPLGQAQPSEAVQALWRLTNVAMPALRSQFDSLMPYIGPVPGRLSGGETAFISAGNLITVLPEGGHDVREISSLTGLMPVGTGGADDAWWVLHDGHVSHADSAVLAVVPTSGATVSVVPESQIREPDGVEPLEVELDNAAVLTSADGGERLHVGDGGFRVGVSGPAGSLVLGVVDQWVVHEGVLPEERVSLHMESLRRGDGNQPIEAAVVRIDPAGRVSAVAWEGEVWREPPDLTAHATTDAFALSSRISGRTGPGIAVTVNGEPATFNDFGAFHAEVDAPIWPRGVSVVARDPVGNETTLRLEVVGFLDYRGLPWLAVLGAATLASGVFLFLRTPRRATVPAAGWGDARLEEIDGDSA